DVAGRVLGGDQVVVGAGRQARVGVRGAGGLGDAVGRAGREAGRGRAVDVVVGHAHVVGGRAPAQADRADAAGGGQVARGRGGLGVAGAVVEDDVHPVVGRQEDVGREDTAAAVGVDAVEAVHAVHQGVQRRVVHPR